MLLLPLVQHCKQQTSLSNGDRDANLSVVTLAKMLKLRLYNWNVGGSLLPVIFVLSVIYFSLSRNNELSKLLAALSPTQVSWKTCIFFKGHGRVELNKKQASTRAFLTLAMQYFLFLESMHEVCGEGLIPP